MSLAQLLKHCVIYAGDQGTNLDHPKFSTLIVKFLNTRLFDKKIL
jgi:hypothetical protein